MTLYLADEAQQGRNSCPRFEFCLMPGHFLTHGALAVSVLVACDCLPRPDIGRGFTLLVVSGCHGCCTASGVIIGKHDPHVGKLSTLF